VVFSEPVLSLAHGGDFDVDHDPKSTPDVVASRSDGTLAVLVYDQDTVEECGSQMAGRFLDVQAGARHFSPRPAGVLAVHLPGGLLGTWDRVTVDEQLNAVVCSYFPSGGDDPGTKAERTVTYPLPGKGRAVSVGDLNGDSIGDLVAVSADAVTPVLTVLLARSLAPIQSVKDEKKLDPDFQWPPADPFYYPSAIAAGEPSARRQPPRLGRLAHGWGGSEGVDPFLAAVDRDNEEVAIFFLNPSLPDREERYPRLGERPIGIVAGQFDAKTGDDVLVGAQDALHLLHNLGPASQPRFEVESIPFAEIQAADPAVKDLDFGQDIELQNPSGGYFDANEFLDVAIPFVSSLAGNSLTTPCGPVVTDEDGEVMLDPDGFPVREPAQVPVDYVIVILNPGAPERRKVRFYRVPDGPNKLEPANLNRDPAVDLIVACGDKVAGTNVVYLLFGDEQHPGTFLEGEPLPPISLCSPPGISKGVAAAASNNGSLRPTPSLTADQWPPVDWILSSVGDTVQVYRRKDWLRQEVENKERWLPVFQVPMEIAHGDDPEGIFVHDFFPDNKGPDGKGLLDVAVIFESEETGVLFFKNNGSASGSLWEEAGPILPVGAPQDLAVIRSAPDLTIAVAARTKQRVEFFQWIGCDQECSFSNIASIPLARANEPGYFTGFASSLQPDGGLALAFRLEDGDLEVGSFPVDLGFFPPRGGATREQLLKIGEADPPLFTRRVWVKAPPGDNQITAALCLGAFSGQESPLDLLAYFPDRFTVCYRGLMDPQNSATIGPNGTAFPPLEGPLVDWREVQPGLLAIATKTAVALHQINSHLPWREPEWSSAEASVDPILRIATGWTSRQKALRTDLFVARLESARVQVETLSGASLELVAGGEEEFGALAAADLNGDGRDDLAVVDSRLQRLHVFLQSGSEGSLAFTQKSVVDYLRFVEPVDLIPLEANGDGRRDLALAARTGEVFLFLGNGAGFFTEPQVQYAGPELEGIRAHDLDGDGRDEILAAVGHPGLVILAGR